MIEKIQSNHLATRRLAELLRVWYHSKSDTEQRWYPIGVGKKDNPVFFVFVFAFVQSPSLSLWLHFETLTWGTWAG